MAGRQRDDAFPMGVRERAGADKQRAPPRTKVGQNDVRRERGQFRRVHANVVGIGRGPAGVYARVRPMLQPNSASACRNAPTRA
jgi:hypothetical protein